MRSVVAAALVWATAAHPAPAKPDLQGCRAQGIGDRDAAAACYQALLLDPSPAVRAEAAWALGDIPAANRGFRAAMRTAPDDPAVRVRWGDLFLEIGQAADAEALFFEALALDEGFAPAKLGLARIALGRFDSRAESLARDVLEIDPANDRARLLLARLALEVGDGMRAREELAGPLASEDLVIRLEAMALAAAQDHLAGVAPSPWEARALELHPDYGALFETVAHFYVITRRYRQAVALLERAVALDSTLWSAYATLGANLLRVNRFADARRSLARAHDGHPYNAEVVNTLRLLDSLDDWRVLEEDGLVLRVAPGEAEALTPYVRRLVADAVGVIGERYDFVPRGPVVVELYPHHEDFAVRTSGLPGIGILGATFGDVLAMDSPSARGIGEGFDWASVLWHEVAHVVTLGATDNRVSRWFSEGVSVLEEWETGPSRFRGPAGARRAVPPHVVDAFRDGRLLAVAELDEGFIRPSYEGQIGVSYVQAGLLCEYMASVHGRPALARMLVAYRDGEDTAGAIRLALGVEPSAVDEGFEAYLTTRFDGIDTAAFGSAMSQAVQAADAGDWTAAAEAARQAVASHPHAVDDPSPYPVLARAEERLGDRVAAVAALLDYWRAGGRRTEPLGQLAGWLQEAGRDAEALAASRSLALVAPLQPRHRARLGDLLLAAGEPGPALAEYRAHMSLGPHDAARAHYRLARAYHALNDAGASRRHVLRALETAPRYGDALDLLLEIDP